jgi:hypothetical protein
MAEEKRSHRQIESGRACDKAKEIGPLQARIQQAEAELETTKKELAELIVAVRDKAMVDEKVFLSLVRVANESAPVRVEFRTGKASAQDIVQKDDAGNVVVEDMEVYLKELMGGVYSQVFERRTVISRVADPRKLYAALANSGKDPWDFLSVSVRDGTDAIVIQALKEHNAQDAVAISDTILPVKDWLENLTLVAKALTDKALTFMREFVVGATAPSIVLASKSKASK